MNIMIKLLTALKHTNTTGNAMLYCNGKKLRKITVRNDPPDSFEGDVGAAGIAICDVGGDWHIIQLECP